MRKQVHTTQLRKNVEGGDVLDVIYTDGTKRKIDRDKLQKRKTHMEARVTQETAEIAMVDADMAMLDDSVKKLSKKTKRV